MHWLALLLMAAPSLATALTIVPDCDDWTMWRCTTEYQQTVAACNGKSSDLIFFGCHKWANDSVWFTWQCPAGSIKRDSRTLRTTITCTAGACSGASVTILPRPI